MGMRIKLQSTNHPNNLLKELNKCRLSETMCDVTIVVGSRSFPAHKAVLACAAEYFQNLFLNTGLDAARTYVVDFITPANFEKILSFVYTSELFTDLINVGVIYEVAERLGMEDLLRACHSTFPDLESTAVAKPLTSDSQSGTLRCSSVDPTHSLGELRGSGEHFGPERNYVLPTDAGGNYKEEERNVTSDTNHSLPLPPKTEDHDAPIPFTSVPSMVTQTVLGSVGAGIPTGASSCQPYKVQSSGDFSKNSFFTPDSAMDITTGTNSCLSNSDHSKDPGFGQVDELQLEDLGEDDLQFEDPAEEIGTAEEVIELSDDSEDELAFAESDSRENKAMPCQVCKKVLEPNIQLIRQHARDHVDLLTGNCKVCETHFQDRNSRVTHVLSHIGIFLFSCDMCEAKFFTQWQLALHRRDGIFENNIIVHPHESLSGKLGLFSGAASPELKCAVCGKALAKDFHVVRGHILDHLNLKGQACSICDQRHLNLCSLMWHTLSHLGISVFSCSVCASSFVDWHLLDKHMAVHQSLEDTLFRCHLCSQSFRSEAAYRYHVSQHKCSSGLDSRSGLGLQHLALQKRKLPAEEFLSEELALQGQPGNSKYSCKVCGKRFAHTSEFNYHRRIHTGEKPYQCKVCHKFFRGRSTIKCHLKTHSGALMYRCTVCGHYSSTLNLMSKHVGVHKGSLPPDFTIEQTFMYIIHSKETEKSPDS